MKQQMNNDELVPLKPFLAAHESEIKASNLGQPLEYEEGRMLLVIGDQPAVLSGEYHDIRATKVTFVRQETTDDE